IANISWIPGLRSDGRSNTQGRVCTSAGATSATRSIGDTPGKCNHAESRYGNSHQSFGAFHGDPYVAVVMQALRRVAGVQIVLSSVAILANPLTTCKFRRVVHRRREWRHLHGIPA